MKATKTVIYTFKNPMGIELSDDDKLEVLEDGSLKISKRTPMPAPFDSRQPYYKYEKDEWIKYEVYPV